MTTTAPKARRPNGEGAIYRDTTSGRWIGLLELGGTGKDRRRRKVTGSTKTEVSKRLAELRKARDAGQDIGRRTPTVEALVRDWLARGAPGPRGAKQASTMDRLRSRLEVHLIPALGSRRVDQLQPQDVEQWLQSEAARGQTRSTLVDYHGDVRQVLNDAVKRRVISWNPAVHATVPQGVPDRERKILSRDELRALYDACSGDRMGPYFVLLGELGLRPQEAEALRWSDITLDADGGELVVMRAIKRLAGGAPIDIGTPKTSKSMRGMELTDRCVDALKRQRVQQARERLLAGSAWSRDERWADLVFTTELGGPLAPGNVRRSLAKACERAGVPVITTYSFRHTATTHMAEDEPDHMLIADQLGHVDTRMVDRVYRHRPAVVRTAANIARRRAEREAGAS